MAKTLKDLSNRIRNLREKLPEAASQIAAQSALIAVYYLTDVTPVDTSTALSNWQLRLGAKSNKTLFPYYPGTKGSTESISEQYADYNALQNVKAKVPGQSIYVTNNVSYVFSHLNLGSSKQEPAFFVERAIYLARQFVVKSKLDLPALEYGTVNKYYPAHNSRDLL